MSISIELDSRSGSACELCGNNDSLHSFTVPPKVGDASDEQIAVCNTCRTQLEEKDELDINHLRCLNDSIWSPVPAVQVCAYRLLTQLENEEWASNLKDMMYMEEETLEWAQAGGDDGVIHKDSNGNMLNNGDTVTIIKDLDVKGANFVAKRGTAVRKIHLVLDNAEHIQGRIDGQTIIILTKFVKKS